MWSLHAQNMGCATLSSTHPIPLPLTATPASQKGEDKSPGAFLQNNRALLAIFKETNQAGRQSLAGQLLSIWSAGAGGTSLHLNGIKLDRDQDSGGRGRTGTVINRAATITAHEGLWSLGFGGSVSSYAERCIILSTGRS